MRLWLIVLSPFVLGALLVGAIKGWERFDKWRETRAMRIRDDNMRRWGFAPYEKSASEKRL